MHRARCIRVNGCRDSARRSRERNRPNINILFIVRFTHFCIVWILTAETWKTMAVLSMTSLLVSLFLSPAFAHIAEPVFCLIIPGIVYLSVHSICVQTHKHTISSGCGCTAGAHHYAYARCASRSAHSPENGANECAARTQCTRYSCTVHCNYTRLGVRSVDD